MHEHEKALTGYLLNELNQIPGIAVVGPTDISLRGGTVSFTLDGIHPHDLGQYLDSAGIAVRTGHHCAWPLTRALGVPATTRASLYLYNDNSDIDALMVTAVKEAKRIFWSIMQLDNLYQEVILDHYKHPENKGLASTYDAQVHHINPSCGDEITLNLTHCKDDKGFSYFLGWRWLFYISSERFDNELTR